MNKNDQRKVIHWFVALLFAAARRVGDQPRPPDSASFDEAESFLVEGEKRGINMGELLSDDLP